MKTEHRAHPRRYLAPLLLFPALVLATAGCNGSYGGGGGGGGGNAPYISGLSVASGLVGTSVTITGSKFGATQGSSTVTFNGKAATPTSWSDTSIVAPVPTGATTGPVVVTVGGVASNGATFTVTTTSSAPTITSLNPTSGAVGTPVTIAGTNFGATPGTSTVTFYNGKTATPTSWSATSIAVTVPTGAMTGNVTVTVGGVTSNGVSFTVSGSTTAKWPIKVSSNGRYFTDASTPPNPWLMVGDSAHHIVNVLPASNWPTYFASRQSLGFNTVNIFSCSHGNCPPTGATADGQVAFTGMITSTCSGAQRMDYDLATPNPNYWAELDNFINMAATYNLVVLFDPLTTADYMNDMRASGSTKAYNFGVFLGNRYKGFPNIIWELGNDFQTWTSTAVTCPATGSDTDNTLVKQMMAGIASVDTNHLITIQLDFQRSYSNQDTALDPYLKADGLYTYYETYDYALKAYGSSPVNPVFLTEANMEGANNTSNLCTAADARILRRQMYWTMTSGASGHVWGNTHVNHSDRYPQDVSSSSLTWQNQLNTPATTEVSMLTSVLNQLQWWKLVPDTGHQIVTAGYGTAAPNNLNLCNSNYATAAWVPDNTTPSQASQAIVYTPVATTLSVNIGMFAKPVAATWFDPTTGTSMAASGSSSFTTPATAHADGTHDWVLVLQ